tara:strand:+ start:2819 stop:3166 length:348 start_codon:yes stop_codon:yes gene_type:complete
MKEILKEVERYVRIKRTDLSYYGDKDVQVMDLLKSTGDADAFCRGNAIKYIARWGKKTDESNVEDLYKAIHYILIMIENSKEKFSANMDEEPKVAVDVDRKEMAETLNMIDTDVE